jgi:hypothetical protein
VKDEKPAMRQWELIEAVHEFLAVCGELDRGAGTLSQRFAFVALTDGRVVYADLVSPTRNTAKPPPFHGGTIGVLNDRDWVFHDGTRTLRFAQGESTFDAAKDANLRDVELSSRWYNLDDALGIVCVQGSGKQLYRERPTAGARGRREHLFHLNAAARLPAQSVLVFYPNQTAAGTRLAAGRCKFVAGADARHFAVVLDDGKRLEFDLQRLNVETP